MGPMCLIKHFVYTLFQHGYCSFIIHTYRGFTLILHSVTVVQYATVEDPLIRRGHEKNTQYASRAFHIATEF